MLFLRGASRVVSGRELPSVARFKAPSASAIEQLSGIALIGGVVLLGAILSIPL